MNCSSCGLSPPDRVPGRPGRSKKRRTTAGCCTATGPNVEIRRTQPLEIGGAPVAAAPLKLAPAPGALELLRRILASRRSNCAAPRPIKEPKPTVRAMASRGTSGAVHRSPVTRPPRNALLASRAPEPAPGAAVLAGSVAVGIIIVNGPTAATRFSESERVKVVAEVQAGLSWLGTQEPAAGVSWNYEIHNVSITTATTAAAADDESRWRNPAMGSLGHTQNWQGVLDYVNGLRTRLHTRWAYCVFFVKGYPLWHFAYASTPRIVMDYANNGWGPDNIDRVLAA